MKLHLLPLAICAALAGCATYYEPAPGAPYNPDYGYGYTTPYAYYPYPYAYPYYYGPYGYSSLWISGTWFCCSGSRHRHHHHPGIWSNGAHR